MDSNRVYNSIVLKYMWPIYAYVITLHYYNICNYYISGIVCSCEFLVTALGALYQDGMF